MLEQNDPWTTTKAEPNKAAINSRLRSIRSAVTPPIIEKTLMGMSRKKLTNPSRKAE